MIKQFASLQQAESVYDPLIQIMQYLRFHNAIPIYENATAGTPIDQTETIVDKAMQKATYFITGEGLEQILETE